MLVRATIHTLDEVLVHTRRGLLGMPAPGKPVFSGRRARVHGLRLRIFALKGTDCVACGAKGTFFAIERHVKNGSLTPPKWHLNLYAADEKGNEVLMTVDHIVPRARGGLSTPENLQPMCARCNQRKADRI